MRGSNSQARQCYRRHRPTPHIFRRARRYDQCQRRALQWLVRCEQRQPRSKENNDVNYTFFLTDVDETQQGGQGRWNSGTSIDGKGTLRTEAARPMGDVPQRGDPDVQTHAQTEQMMDGKTFLEKAADFVSGS